MDLDCNNKIIEETLREYRGMFLDNSLIHKINKEINLFNPNIQLTNKTTLGNLSRSIFNKGKDKENIKNKNLLFIKIRCNQCRFIEFIAIKTPLIIYEINKIEETNKRHPLHTAHQHIIKTGHPGFDTSIIRECATEIELDTTAMVYAKKNKREPSNNLTHNINPKIMNEILFLINKNK
jgi:hypothetical protein